MKKKIIKIRTNCLAKSFSVSSILKKPMTTRSDLEFLLNKLEIEPFRVVWLKDADPNYREAQVINLGNKTIGGSHWVCTYDGKYFDSFGMVVPEKLDHLEWIPLQKQNQNYGHCGQYVCLWLYYAKMDELDKFYNLFETLN